jgi:hypothetical protein
LKKLLLLFAFLVSGPAWSQQVMPPNQTSIAATQPTISATFPNRVRGAKIWVDGTEFTHYLRTDGNVVSLVPPYNLDYGTHQVQVQADNGQRAFWAFNVVNGNQGYYPGNSNSPYANNGQACPTNNGTGAYYPAYPNGGYSNNGYNNNSNNGYYYPSNNGHSNQNGYNNRPWGGQNGQAGYTNGANCENGTGNGNWNGSATGSLPPWANGNGNANGNNRHHERNRGGRNGNGNGNNGNGNGYHNRDWNRDFGES